VDVGHRLLVLGVVERGVELGVLLLLDILCGAGPDRLVGVDDLPVPNGLLDLAGFGDVLFLLVLDLGLLAVLLGLSSDSSSDSSSSP
jgi:hypothetical protein